MHFDVGLITYYCYFSSNLNKEEALEKLVQHDGDGDGQVTISEYLKKVYGYSIEEIYEFEKDKNPEARELAMVS